MDKEKEIQSIMKEMCRRCVASDICDSKLKNDCCHINAVQETVYILTNKYIKGE